MYKPKLEKDIRCPLEYGLSVFGGKWKSRIICVLAENERLRYSAIRREMANITDAVLAATLKELMNNDMIERHQFYEIPPRVEYGLTAKGYSSVPILQSICKWSGAYHREDNEHTMRQCQKCDYNQRTD
ncbi:helix-turn-helix domain-containing protein [Megasphaera sp. DISK 18]|uniref:winged helix-turn-helix transcriptional regulator n=1 Tax=Megasphaera sp. DISK 18 TaxID=1776081 RepID=UPI0008071633|nr:helix-turn-helix domain-containing protein [Megasphaera sp. DISK 18]OBZ33561.1 HxlR family transcriptional regulator [Megasphaera sp. DISK 18]